MNRLNRGFTLVELLVVITIIGILIALIVPGVQAVRENGRQTVCLSNQMNVAKAILLYELNQRHLPGILNKTKSGVTYNWAEAIFPDLEHQDLWEMVIAGSFSTSSVTAPQVKVLICPNDPILTQPTAATYAGLMSYSINDGFFLNYANTPPTDIPGNKVAATSSSKLTSRPTGTFPRGEAVTASTTIMLGEMTGNGTTAYPHISGPWTVSTNPVPSPTVSPYPTGATPLTFHWPAQNGTAGSPTPVGQSPGGGSYLMTSAHPGKIMVTFFDGHGEAVTNDTAYPQ
jgi:prepilin-type N-terminal cleavage/methylation domain-containing protein/prepilin-type processing-associated H-X9-DG protein